jgi:PTS system nitrogen regulatory IIA component
MKLAEYLSKECIQVGLKVGDKADVLKHLAMLAKKSPLVGNMDEKEIFQGFMEREKLGSTGFGNQIAIPHFTSDQVDEFLVGILTLSEGIDFQSMDSEPARIFVFIIAPQTKRNQHLGILSNIARFLKSSDNLKALIAADSADALYQTILRHSYTDEEVQNTYENNLFHVIVQDESKFEDVLNIFTELNDCSISVIEASKAGKYLYAMPLFASFWNEEQKGFNRIIVSVVKKTETNRTLQQLNSLIDQLENGTGITVLVQDLFYSAGSCDV